MAVQSRTGIDKTSSRIGRSEAWAGYLFILPGIIGLALFVLYPLVSSTYFSLTEWNGASLPKFVGLENFRYLFTQDPTFLPSLKATFIWVFTSVPVGLVAGLLLALLVNRSFPGIRFFRTAMYLPVVLPAVATLTLWKFIFNPAVGLANQILAFFNLPSSLWLGDVRLVYPALLLTIIWGAGGGMVIFLAALQAVPTELYEAARLDGAVGWRLFWHITVPLISPVLVLQAVTGAMGALTSIAQPQFMTGGGPDLSTNFLMYKIFTTAFGPGSQYGMAIAEVWVLFVLVIIVTFVLFRVSNAYVFTEEGAE